MKTIYLTDEEIKKIKRYNKIFEGGEAKLYRFNDDVLKLYHKYIIDEKEETVDYILKRDKIKGCVLPNNKVYIQNKFSGISMDYIENYKTLYQNIGKRNLDYKTRLLICEKIVQAVKNLHENEIIHTDINLENILLSSESKEVLLIDNDGGLPKELINKEDYNKELNNDKYLLMLVVMSWAYELNFERFIYKHGIKNFKEVLTCLPIGKDLYKYILDLIDNREKSEGYIDNYFYDIQETPIRETIKCLIKR